VDLGIDCGQKLSPTEFKQQQEFQEQQENTRAAAEAGGMIDFSNSSPRTRQVLQAVVGITQAQLQSHAAATPEAVYYGVATQLMAHYPHSGMTMPLVPTGVQTAPVPMSSFPPAGSPTITHGAPQPYPVYAGPPGGYMPYQTAPTSAPIQTTPGYGVPSSPAGVSPAGSPISPHQVVPGQQPWPTNWYTHYHQPPPSSVSPQAYVTDM
jgi:hypothetical protein